MIEDDQALVEAVELSIDWNMDLPEEDYKRYNELIEREEKIK